jgi:putative ABC transport system ATP-binding protein
MELIELDDVTKVYESGEASVTALKHVTLSIGEASFVSFVGPSGSGKSTLLNLLGCLDQPTEGSVTIAGTRVNGLDRVQRARFRGANLGFVFQNYNLIPNLTAIENVMLPLEFANMPSKKRRTRAQSLLEQVGLDASKQSRKPGRLSGGEQQRVAIARAIANKPKLILADEPTGNLDLHTGKMIFDLLHNLAKSEKTTIVVVTHDLEIAGKTDVTFKLQDGKLLNTSK